MSANKSFESVWTAEKLFELRTAGWKSHVCFRRSTGFPLPQNAGELKALCGSMLEELLVDTGLKGKTLESLTQELLARDVLSTFDFREHLPRVLDVQQVYDLLSAKYGSWMGFMNRHGKTLTVMGATPTSLKASFHTHEILSLYRNPRFRFFNKHRSLFPAQTIRAFEDYVRAAAERVIYDWKKMSEKSTEKTIVRANKPEAVVSFVGWPIGVPRNYDALYREYRVFVERTLNRYVKPCPSQQIEDVKQHIWLKLVESRTIEKFVEKAKYRKIQAKLTATEAVEYLGITWDQWMGLMRRDLKWLQPSEGSLFSASAVFSGDQIRNVEESGIFPIVDAIPASDMTKVFRGYLTNVVHNHFANYCRTRVRRFIKDNVVPNENSRVNGGHLGSALDGDMTSWEDALEDHSEARPDEGLDLPEVDSVEELHEDLTEQIDRIHKSCPGRQEDVLDLIAEGLTLREAIGMVRAQVQEEKLKARVG